MAELEEGSDDGEDQRIKSVVGVDGLREFVMLPEWTVNAFTSTIKEPHFKTLWANYQIPNYIPIRLPYKSEKYYYEGVNGVGVYEQVLKAALGFLWSPCTVRFLSTWAYPSAKYPQMPGGSL